MVSFTNLRGAGMPARVLPKLPAAMLFLLVLPAVAAGESASSTSGTDNAEYALVYFVNELVGWFGIGSKGKVQVFVDGEPVALLPHKGCTRKHLKPGFHDIHPDQWLYFEGGRTYLLRTEGHIHEWLLDDAASLDTVDCEHVELTDADRQTLAGKRWRQSYSKRAATSWKRYEKFIAKVGVSPPRLLPLKAKASQYRKGLERERVGGYIAGGKLSVDREGIRWKAGKKTVQIAAEEIRQVSLGRYLFVHVAYGDPGDLQHAHFSGEVWSPGMFKFGTKPYLSEHYNLIFLAIENSARLARGESNIH